MQRHTYSLPRGLTLLFINLFILLPGSLIAHPHMSLEAKVDFVLEGKTCTGAWMEWTFDPLFSAAIIGEHDTNRDGRFDTKENTQVYQRAFINLKTMGTLSIFGKETHDQIRRGWNNFRLFRNRDGWSIVFLSPSNRILPLALCILRCSIPPFTALCGMLRMESAVSMQQGNGFLSRRRSLLLRLRLIKNILYIIIRKGHRMIFGSTIPGKRV